MKIAITTKGKDLDSKIDPRFGRAESFIIYDTKECKYEVIDNIQNVESQQGAGIQAAQNIVDKGANALITAHCGPKAFRVLSSAGVKIYVLGEGSVRTAIERFKNNKLQEMSDPNTEGHWM
jgi:predicted Fe-Mo cluster-binding NifX family protein